MGLGWTPWFIRGGWLGWFCCWCYGPSIWEWFAFAYFQDILWISAFDSNIVWWPALVATQPSQLGINHSLIHKCDLVIYSWNHNNTCPHYIVNQPPDKACGCLWSGQVRQRNHISSKSTWHEPMAQHRPRLASKWAQQSATLPVSRDLHPTFYKKCSLTYVE